MKQYENTLTETNSRRNAKNTVFLDLFSIPEYCLQMFQTLHPEITDVTVDDIEIITLNPVILNLDYNDLGFMVKDKLIIFVEAQSTWTINILIRILMYLASTYHDYIIDKNLHIYASKKAEIPEPEFYVIYTGNKKFEKDTVSLREDFWNNPNAKIDLIAKIIYAENKNDIIGQYIIFCHVLDEQVKIHGRNKTAIINTINICQNKNVLKNYLETRKKEVMDTMFLLFDQKYNVEAYAREKAEAAKEEGVIEGKIQGIIEACKELGSSIEKAINIVIEKFNFSKDEASEYVHKFWKEEN